MRRRRVAADTHKLMTSSAVTMGGEDNIALQSMSTFTISAPCAR